MNSITINKFRFWVRHPQDFSCIFIFHTKYSSALISFYTNNLSSLSPLSSSFLPLILTMAGADSKADSFLLTVKDHIETLHDDGPHHSPGARLGHSKFIAVFLGRGHIFYWPQVLLNRNRKRKSLNRGVRSQTKKEAVKVSSLCKLIYFLDCSIPQTHGYFCKILQKKALWLFIY